MDRNAFKEINDTPIILDFTGCKYWGEIHKVLKNTFDFPDYYGENLDALWDCLRDYNDEDTIQVYVKGVNQIPKELSEHIEQFGDGAFFVQYQIDRIKRVDKSPLFFVEQILFL